MQQHTSSSSILRPAAYFMQQHNSSSSILHAAAYFVQQHTSCNSILHATTYFIQQHTSEPAAYLKYAVPGSILEVCGRILEVCGPGPGPPNTFVLVINSLSCNSIQVRQVGRLRQSEGETSWTTELVREWTS
ncbi:hypothetical protein L1987_87103 [Smallanthus sonchifolius]|nr:hypothetical protein L1987_87103 [Smallanthus sonchifolius]